MAKIRKDDLHELNPFGDLKKSAEEARASVVLLEKSLEAIKAASKVVRASTPNEVSGSKDIKALNDAQEKANQLAKNKMLIDKELAKERVRLQQLNREYNASLKEEIALENKQIGTLERLKVENSQLRREREKLNLETKEGTQRMREINAQLDKNNALIKESADAQKRQTLNVGNYGSALDGLKGKLMNVAGAFGLAFGAGALLRSAGETIATFNQSIADLQAITGAAGADLEYFKNQAIELGKNTEGGAAAVVEAYKLIGSAKPELLENASALNEVTEAAITLSKASGLELPDAATRLTDAMNQFGADASQATRFIDALANGAKFGAAEIPDVTDAMLKFGAVAKTSNISLEESTGLIEALAERGLKGAEAGTALRNVMLKLSAPDALPKEAQERLKQLGINFERLNDESIPFSERLSELKPLLNDNAALVKTFGTENAVAATNLIMSIDRIEELTEKMGTQGTASEQAEIRSKTLGEAWANVGRAWDSMVLQLANGESTMSGVRNALDWFARNLPTIVTWVGKLSLTFASYKAVMISIKMVERVKEMVDYARGVAQTSDAFERGQKGVKAFGSALKGIGLTVAIKLVIDFAMALYDVASGAQRARFEMDMFNEATAKGADKAAASLNKVKNALQDEINAIRLRGLSEAEEQRLIAEATARTEKRIQTTIKTLYTAREATADQLEVERERLKNLERLYGNIADLDPFTRLKIEEQKNVIANLRAEYKAQNAAIEALKTGAKDLNQEVVDLNVAQIDNTRTVTEQTKAIEDQNDAMMTQEERIEFLRKLREKFDAEEKARAEESKRLAEEMPDLGLPLYTDAPTGEDITDPDARFQFDKKYIDLATDYFIKRADERIAKIDEEMKVAEERADLYRKLAAEGNATAKESLAEQDRIIAENNLKKEQEEKRKQRILLVSSILQAYNSNLQSGDNSTEAFTKAITSSGVLQQFIAALPAFEKGTEDTGLNGAGVDGRGGMLSVLHPGERVMTKEQNEKMKGISNEEAADIIHNYRYGKLVDAQIGGAWESAAVVKQLMSVKGELAEVKRAIIEKPEHTAEIINATASGFTLLHREKRPFKTITKRFKA